MEVRERTGSACKLCNRENEKTKPGVLCEERFGEQVDCFIDYMGKIKHDDILYINVRNELNETIYIHQ